MVTKNSKPNELNTTLAKVRLNLAPTKAELLETSALVKEVLARINPKIKPARALLGGSGAKNTFLRGHFDMDIFVEFPFKQFKDKNDILSDWLGARLKKIFSKVERVHGSRDYFRLQHKNVQFEIIPILKISKAQQAVNITDVSPLHAVWVKKYANKKLLEEIRLLKAFSKGIGVYGAESYIRGFSGYVCEILTIHYGSFTAVLKSSQKWLPGETIDTMKHLKGKPAFMFMNKSKLQSPLIIVDPVQHNRNAAAALDMEAFSRFQKKAAEFLAQPKEDYFTRTFKTPKQIQAQHKGKSTIIRMTPIDGKEDVAGAAMHKAIQYIERKISENEFLIKESDWEWDKNKHAFAWFVAKKEPLSEQREQEGPLLRMEQHAASFKKQYPSTIVKRSRLFAITKRKHTTIRSLIEELIKNDSYIKSKAKKIEIAS